MRLPGKKGAFFSYADPLSTKQVLERADVLIHLAGENIAKGRWTKKKKQGLKKSRIETTKALVQAMEACSFPPKVFLCASAVNYAGEKNDQSFTEDVLPEKGFLSQLCQEWEDAATTDRSRCAQLRFGMVLGPYGAGSALDPMAFLTKLGLSAKLSTGKQFISWIHIEDALRAIDWVIQQSLEGPIHISSPYPERQDDFARLLAKMLQRPYFLKMPRWLMRAFLGEIADELFCKSVKAIPKKLLDSGFCFSYPDLRSALQKILQSKR